MIITTQFIFGLAPPTIINWLPIREFNEHNLSWLDGDYEHTFIGFALFGVMVWIYVSLFLSRRYMKRFRMITNRLGPLNDDDSFRSKQVNPFENWPRDLALFG